MENLEVSAEVHFAQKLASNEKKIRDRALKRLQKYLSVRASQKAGLSEEDLVKIWKGLHYCMWMQDKPLIQEELSGRITKLLHSFSKLEDGLKFVKVFLDTQAREWNGIDKLRLDKFLMMVRDIFHETFTLLSGKEWPSAGCVVLSAHLHRSVMKHDSSHVPDGLRLHVADLFVEELTKVSLEHLTTENLLVLLMPFILYVAQSKKIELARRVMKGVVQEVINTLSDGGKGETTDSSSGEKAGSDEKDDEQEEDMEVEEEEEEEAQSSFKVEMVSLLTILLFLARQKQLRQPNRDLLYTVAREHPHILNTLLSHLDSIPAEGTTTNEALSPAVKAGLQILSDFGQASDHTEGADPRRRKKRRGKKRKGVDMELTEGESEDSARETSTAKNTGNAPGEGGDSDENNSVPAKKRKRTRDTLVDDSGSVGKHKELVLPDSSGDGSAAKGNKRVKGKGQKESGGSKFTDGARKNEKVQKQSKEVVGLDSTASGSNGAANTNSNAKPKGLKAISRTPVELVKYKQDHGLVVYSKNSKTLKGAPTSMPRRRTFLNEEDSQMMIGTNSLEHISNDEGPDMLLARRTKGKKRSSPSKDSSPQRGRKGKGKQKGRKGGQAKKESGDDCSVSEDSASGTSSTSDLSCKASCSGETQGFQGVAGKDQREPHAAPTEGQESTNGTSVLTSLPSALIMAPCNFVKKTIAGIRSPSQDASTPASEKSSQVKCCDDKSGNNTPNSAKKKVVFDLRRNKANKIQDYLRSLAVCPSPPVPSQSPSQSILKSSSTTSQGSPSLSSSSTDAEGDRRGGRKSQRRASAPGRYSLVGQSKGGKLFQQTSNVSFSH